MSNNQDAHKTRSYVPNSELPAITSDPERTMGNRAHSSFLNTFSQAEHWSDAVLEPEKSLEAAHESDTEGPLIKLQVEILLHRQ